jgi:hypothetical protein
VTARSDNFDTVVIEMKDESGHLLYLSGLEMLENAASVVTGQLSAAAIAAAAADAGLRPIARVNTLKDHVTPARFEIRYAGWLDGRLDDGGRPWANPLLERTQTYISAIVAELHAAGFEQVILANTIFPALGRPFSSNDLNILPNAVTNLETRFGILGDFVNIVARANPEVEILIEVAAGCFSGGTASGSAEILRNSDFADNITGIIPVFTRDDFAREGIDTAVAALLETAAAHRRGLEVIPLLDAREMSDDDRVSALGAFVINGSENFMLRN